MKATECLRKANIDTLIGIPYSDLDCQALMEKILKRGGVKAPNWRGSNHMWRDALSDKMPIDEMIARYRQAVPGCWLFTIRDDGGEQAKGYNDNEGNAAHVGWCIDGVRVIHSTSGGVQYDTVSSKRWTHAGFCRLLEYPENEHDLDSDDVYSASVKEALNKIVKIATEVLEND